MTPSGSSVAINARIYRQTGTQTGQNYTTLFERTVTDAAGIIGTAGNAALGVANQASATVNGCTVYDNVNGAILNNGTMNLHNSILADSFGADCDGGGTFTSPAGNLIEQSANACVAVGALTGDPGLFLLADNGGPTLTHAIAATSPAADAGDNATCTAKDQRGSGRPRDADKNGTAV